MPAVQKTSVIKSDAKYELTCAMFIEPREAEYE